jgi:peptidoglycan/xylan/chitin deacetylase (PgdA/CDA1 family)
MTPVSFVYPYGEQNATVRSKVQSAGYLGARGVFDGYNNKDANKYLLSDQHLEQQTTVAQAEGYIDTALAQKSWLIFEIHEQSATAGQYANDPAVLQAIIDYLKANNVKVVSLKDGLALMN